MKWIFLLACFASATAYGQLNKNSVLEKLKSTNRLMGKYYSNPFPDGRISQNQFNSNKRAIINTIGERAVIVLPQDNMPCIRPDMRFFKVMPNIGSLALLEHPSDPGIYVNRRKFLVGKN
jgi:hypothetical protein